MIITIPTYLLNKVEMRMDESPTANVGSIEGDTDGSLVEKLVG